MSQPDSIPRATPAEQSRVLRQLYMRLMFRSRRSSHKRRVDPLAGFGISLCLFAMLGIIALAFGPLGFTWFSSCLHALTFGMIGINLAATSGSLLFSAEEADVLLHRPIAPRALLTAKVRVIVQVSLALAVALNLCGMMLGVQREEGTWLFIPAHLLSLTLEVIFCTSFVVLAYNLCLKWFGRERLENLMTTVQVLVAVGGMLAGQIVPRVLGQLDDSPLAAVPDWLVLLPPTWFAAIDAALCSRGESPAVPGLAAFGVLATVLTAWVAVNRLAATYEQGLVILNETAPGGTKSSGVRGRWALRLLNLPVLRLWLRDPVERAAFRLTLAELTRSRGVKLRVYPMLAQLLVYPLVIFFGSTVRTTGLRLDPFSLAFTGAFVSMLPTMVLDRLRLAEDWRGADIFRQAPIPSVAALFHGTRKAVILVLCVPGIAVVIALGLVWLQSAVELSLIIPGLLALPLFSLLPGLGRGYLPFSETPEVEAHNARGCLSLAFFMSGSFAIAGLAGWAWDHGYFLWMLVAEAALTFSLSALIRRVINRRPLKAEL